MSQRYDCKGSLLALVLAAALTACGQRSPDELVASGKASLAKGDAKTAAVEFKAALQAAPKSSEARLLLGRTLLTSGEPAVAIVELRKALELGVPKAQVAPDLARAMLQVRQASKVIEEFGDLSIDEPGAAADLLTSIGSAYSELGKIEQARASMTAALKRSPDFAGALILKARLLLGEGDVNGALALLDGVLRRDPKDLVARMLVGDLKLIGNGNLDDALAEYRRVLEIKPDHVRAHSSLIMALVRQKKIDAAKEQLARLKAVAPNHPQVRFHEAQLALIDKDLSKAREHALVLLKQVPEHAPFLHLAAVIESQFGNHRQAGQYLIKALQVEPGRADLRGALAQTYLRLGQPEKAYEAVRDLAEGTGADASMLALAAEAQLQTGNFDRARELFQRAVKVRPNDASVQTSLALLNLSAGDREAGLRQLHEISARAPESVADQALVSVLARQRDFDGALRAIDDLARKDVPAPLPYFLRGQIELLRGNTKVARQHFESALVKNPGHMPSLAALAELDLAANQFAAATARYEAALKVDPKNAMAMAEISRIRSRAGAPKEEVVKRLGEAIKTDPLDATVRVMLVDYLMAKRDAHAAVQAAQDGAAVRGESLELLDRLGRAQLMAGDSQQAMTAFRKLAQLQPKSAEPYLRLADVYIAMNNASAAEASLRQAVTLAPDSLLAQTRLVRHLMQGKNTEAALAVARSVQKQRPKESAGFLMESEIQTQARKIDSSLAILRTGLAATGSTDLAIRLHRQLSAAGRPKDALALVADWSKTHPKDTVFLRSIGDFEMQRHNYAAAEQHYAAVIRLNADNAPVLNNLAWLRLKLGKPGARDLAQRAVALEPGDLNHVDTLAQALLAEKRPAEAVEAAKRVLQSAGATSVLRLSAVEVLIRAGERKSAEAELDKLGLDKSNSYQQSEVGRLRAMLRS